MDINTLKEKALKIYDIFHPYIKSIYLGGSLVSGFIKDSHDIDFIIFTDSKENAIRLTITLEHLKKRKPELFEENDCWKQIRVQNKVEVKVWSYLYNNMVFLCGEKQNFLFDPINNEKDYNKYLDVLLTQFNALKYKKRMYHIYRGYLLLSKKTYELSDEEKTELNILHDCKEEDYRIRENIQLKLKKNILELKNGSKNL